MPTMQEVRAKFPQYNDMSDEQLAGALHRKFYADMPFDQFAGKIGLMKPQTVNAEGKGDRERSWSETGMDVLKSGGTGLMQGTIGLASLPQDVGTWLGNSVGYGIDRLMGKTPEEAQATTEKVNAIVGQRTLRPPSGAEMTRAYESTFGPMYQPQTTAGEYARSIGEFVPSALAGPGSAVRKAALAVVPAVASETGGQIAREVAPEYEPYARVAGALLGGVAAAERPSSATKAMLKKVGDADAAHAAIKAETNQAYNQLRQAGIRYDANSVDAAISNVAGLRIDPVLDPKASRLRDLFVQHAGTSPDFEDIDNLKQIATGILRSNADKRDKQFVGKILDGLVDVTDRSPFITNGSIPAGQATALVARAKDLARRNILADQIDEMGRKAKYYVSGTESGLRNQFASYLKSQKGKGLSDVEEAAFDAVTRREGPMNVAHMLGSRFSQPALAMGGGYFGGPIGAALGYGANLAFRKGMEMSTKKAVDNALKTVLAGRAEQAAASAGKKLLKGQRRVQSLLAVEGGSVQGRKDAQEPFLTDAKGRKYPYPKASLLGRKSKTE